MPVRKGKSVCCFFSFLTSFLSRHKTNCINERKPFLFYLIPINLTKTSTFANRLYCWEFPSSLDKLVEPQVCKPTKSLRALWLKQPRIRFLLFGQAFYHVLADMRA